jgi:hypothetical protein
MGKRFNSLRCWLAVAIASLGGGSVVDAAQQTFWPLDQFPPSIWSFAQTNGAGAVSFPNGLIIRRLVITNLTNPITPPPLAGSATYSASGASMRGDFSTNGGATFSSFSAPADLALRLVHTNDASRARLFDGEMLSLNAAAGSLPPGVRFRESLTLVSSGQASLASTNGGYAIGAFINLRFELSVNNGATWLPGNVPAYVELSGPPGVPAIMSITNAGARAVQISWTTQTNVHYQLQRTDSLGTSNWANMGVPLAGDGARALVSDSTTRTHRFYRVLLSP